MNKKLPPESTNDYYGSYEQIHKHLSKIGNRDQECGVLITLDKGCFLIKTHLVSLGSWNSDCTDLSVLFNRIVADKASRFLFAHNHPNGMSVISKDDVRFTIAVVFLADLLGVDFTDHVIFPYKRDMVSIKEKYPLVFKRNYQEIFCKATSKFLPKI